MHPAYSVILFTTASGAGYGLLFLFALFGATGVLPPERWLGFTGFALGFALVTAGLLSSTFHLGHPERAWRAVTQWRSSWLSREGVASLVTYLPAGLLAIGWVFLERSDGFWGLCAVLTAIATAVTVYCTAMIYASLKPIRQWHNGWVAPAYLVMSLASGGLWFAFVTTLFGQDQRLFLWIAATALALSLLVKLGYWHLVDTGRRPLKPEDATGLSKFGRVKPFEPPHTGSNYLQQEMGFKVARKHAAKLRIIAAVAGFAVPLLLVLLTLFTGPDGWAAGIALFLAVVSCSLGLLVERWLFFAEAQHTVTLYYSAEAA